MFLKPNDVKGYLQVTLSKDGVRKNFLLHVLVAEAYLPNPENLPQVGHRDENSKNNALSNLYWTNTLDNNNMPLHKKRISEAKKKLVKCVELDKVFESQQQAAEKLGLNPSAISMCCTGKRKTTGGYHFEFVKEDSECST